MSLRAGELMVDLRSVAAGLPADRVLVFESVATGWCEAVGGPVIVFKGEGLDAFLGSRPSLPRPGAAYSLDT